jgi:hypothetical protein
MAEGHAYLIFKYLTRCFTMRNIIIIIVYLRGLTNSQTKQGNQQGFSIHCLHLMGWFCIIQMYSGRAGIVTNGVRLANGMTVPSRTGSQGNLSVVKALIMSGADPNAKDDQGVTALHYAHVHAAYHWRTDSWLKR